MKTQDPLAECAEEYRRTADLTQFMEGASEWILHYCRIRLNRDPDIVGDFYVHFYERAEVCLERYRSRTHLPFTGYLASYLRHEFMNFIRAKRAAQIPETVTDDFYSHASRLESDLAASDRLRDKLVGLDHTARVQLKLYHGLDLTASDIRIVHSRMKSAGRTALFLAEYASRKQRYRERIRTLEDRARRLDYLLHREASPDRAVVLTRWKTGVRERMQVNSGILSLSEIGEMFGQSKSAVGRRLDKAVREIREGALCRETA